MATSGSAIPRYTRYPDSMRRTAPAAHSRIPVPEKRDEGRHVSAPHHRSRLLAMQETYQKKLLKEKEEKMAALYNKHQDEALQRLHKQDGRSGMSNFDGASGGGGGKGIVRDFFKERREMEQSKGSANVMSRDIHFRKKLLEKKKTSELTNEFAVRNNQKESMRADLQEQKRHEERKEQEMQSYKNQWQQSQMQQQPKTGKGIVRSNPLAPIKRESGRMQPLGPPSPSYEHYETSGNLAYDDADDVAMKQLSKPQKVSHRSSRPKLNADDDPIQRNAPKVPSQPHRTKALSNKQVAPPIAREKPKLSPVKVKKEKKSDFMKWQEEQDAERQERLMKYEAQLSPAQDPFTVDYDRQLENEREAAKMRRKKEYDDMMKKERELEAMITKHKNDLARMSVDNSSDEEDNFSPLPQKTHAKPLGKKGKPSSKPAKHYDDPSPPPYSRPVEDDYESRAGEFKAREREERPVQPKPKAKPKRKLPPKEPDPLPEFQPPPPLAYDTSFYQDADDGGPPANINLQECSNCGRQFAVERLAKHETVCRKSSQKKRKVFDSTKQRTEGTESEKYVRNGKHLKSGPAAKRSDWRRKHEEFVRSIRDARETQAYVAKGGNLADLPPPPPAENPDYKKCPYCDRRFNPTTAERHIPRCKDIKNRPKPPPRKK